MNWLCSETSTYSFHEWKKPFDTFFGTSFQTLRGHQGFLSSLIAKQKFRLQKTESQNGQIHSNSLSTVDCLSVFDQFVGLALKGLNPLNMNLIYLDLNYQSLIGDLLRLRWHTNYKITSLGEAFTIIVAVFIETSSQ